jgi:hypothetical protein
VTASTSRSERCYGFTRVRALFFAFTAMAAVVFVHADHGGAPVAAQDMQSTMSGVYTAPQAVRGEETYMGAGFRGNWRGRPLSDLFDQVREKMPKNDPASLSQQEYIQLIAYLLKINGVPAGETELPPDNEVLRKIRIEMPTDDRDH